MTFQGFRNFGQVDVGLYRSGRMTAGALAVLQQAMERLTVIDLRDRPPLFAPRTYRRLRIVFERMPIDETQPLPEATIEELLARMAKRPLLIHCWKGAHRTGAICALYRIRVQGWSLVEAWQEMIAYGFGKIDAHSALFQSVFGEWRPSIPAGKASRLTRLRR